MTGWDAGGEKRARPPHGVSLRLFVTALALLGLAPLLMIAPATPAVASAPAAATGKAIDADLLEQVVRDGDIQTSFTEPPEPNPTPTPQWLRDLVGWLFGDGNALVKGLGWLLVAAVVLGALYLTVPWVRDLVDSLIARFRRKRDDDGEGDDFDWQPDVSGARNLLAEADRLAEQGRYGEAAHLVLGRSLEDIASRRPGLLKPALTARAIAMMGELPSPASAAFGRIAAVVERSLWARQPIDQSAWQDARSAYEDFAFGAHWRGGVT